MPGREARPLPRPRRCRARSRSRAAASATAMHRHRVPGRHRHGRRHSAAELVGADGDDDPRPAARAARLRRQDPVDRAPAPDGGGIEAAGERDSVAQGLARTQLVDRRPGDLARPRSANPPCTGTNTTSPFCSRMSVGLLPLEQVVVEVEASPPARVPRRISTRRKLPLARRPPGGVQRGQRRCRRSRSGRRPGRTTSPATIDLDVPEPGRARAGTGCVARRRRRTPEYTRREPGVELVLSCAERQVGDIDLAHLRDHHESFAGHLEGVATCSTSPVRISTSTSPGPEPVVLVHRARLGRLEPGRRAAEGLEAETLSPSAEHARASRPASRRAASRLAEPERVEQRRAASRSIDQESSPPA